MCLWWKKLTCEWREQSRWQGCSVIDLRVSPLQVKPLYESVVTLFHAYFKHHAGTVAPPKASGGGAADDEEADASEDLLQVGSAFLFCPWLVPRLLPPFPLVAARHPRQDRGRGGPRALHAGRVDRRSSTCSPLRYRTIPPCSCSKTMRAHNLRRHQLLSGPLLSSLWASRALCRCSHRSVWIPRKSRRTLV